MSANALRGEVDVLLDGQRFVLRPSYSAILAAEEATGKPIVKLAAMAGDGDLSLADSAHVVACLIRAWGEASGDRHAAAVNARRIGELIHEAGLMQVQLRLALVLGLACTGGCTADGLRRDDPGEATATGTTTSATPVAGSPE